VEHFNKKETLEQLGDDEDLLREIIEAFINDAPNQIITITNAIQNKDGDTLMRNAHTLKSTSAMLYAHSVSQIAKQMEEAGKLNNFTISSTLLIKLNEAFQLLMNELKTELSV